MLNLTDAAEFKLEQTIDWMRELDELGKHCEMDTTYELQLFRKLNYLRTYNLFKTKENGVRYVDSQEEMKVILTPDSVTTANHNFGVIWKIRGDHQPFMTGLLYWNGPNRTCPTDLMNGVNPSYDIRLNGHAWEWSVHT